jgi:ElaB/YqjD/DUF883 family membrane-anchored ribosome-binding protein
MASRDDGDDRELVPRDDERALAERRPELTPEERLAELRASIRDSRAQISESVEQIRDEAREAVDWRGWVEEHPWEAVGAAFTAGFLLGFR